MDPLLTRRKAFWFAVGAGTFLLAWRLRQIPFSLTALSYGYMQGASSLIAFACAASAFVRHRGTRDFTALTLFVAFAFAGLVETGLGTGWFEILPAGSPSAMIPVGWIVKRTALAGLFVAALLASGKARSARPTISGITGALLIALGFSMGTIIACLVAPEIRSIRPHALVPRAYELIPAAIFAVAAVGYHRRLVVAGSSFDRGIWLAAILNVGCQILVSQSAQLFDAPFFFAELAEVSGYVLVVGGKLVDNTRLFEQVRLLAVTDALTGLANYRRLLEVLQNEMQRFNRSGRPFALLLLDVNDLKGINDTHGHPTGSRVLARLGQVLRVQSRVIDTPARYGGDEFAVVLPDTSDAAARQFAQRICDQLALDGEKPRFSVSIGVAVCPDDGRTVEKILSAADQDLYEMKTRAHKGAVARLENHLSNSET